MCCLYNETNTHTYIYTNKSQNTKKCIMEQFINNFMNGINYEK